MFPPLTGATTGSSPSFSPLTGATTGSSPSFPPLTGATTGSSPVTTLAVELFFPREGIWIKSSISFLSSPILSSSAASCSLFSSKCASNSFLAFNKSLKSLASAKYLAPKPTSVPPGGATLPLLSSPVTTLAGSTTGSSPLFPPLVGSTTGSSPLFPPLVGSITGSSPPTTFLAGSSTGSPIGSTTGALPATFTPTNSSKPLTPFVNFSKSSVNPVTIACLASSNSSGILALISSWVFPSLTADTT